MKNIIDTKIGEIHILKDESVSDLQKHTLDMTDEKYILITPDTDIYHIVVTNMSDTELEEAFDVFDYTIHDDDDTHKAMDEELSRLRNRIENLNNYKINKRRYNNGKRN